MRLAGFILENIETILLEWEAFAGSVWPGPESNPHALRDHAEAILRATVRDMNSAQSAVEQSDKSKGEGLAGRNSIRVDGISDVHAIGRVRSGFDLMAVVAEYRALRASVIRLWRESAPEADRRDLADLTRFNESIDQSLTKAIRSYTERVDHSRQMFLAILGHDLRNPLNSVLLSAQVLSHEAQLDAESSRAISQITSSAAAMAQMITDLLDFTSIGLGIAMPLAPAEMDLQALCAEVVDEMRAVHPACLLRMDACGDLAGAWDASRLRQVISNLLGNAFQHGAADCPVSLSLRGERSDVLLSVRNDGCPIPREILGTIFEPLVRGSTSQAQKQRRPGSIGLGLFIAREVVTAHGGTIDVESSEKAGTVFRICLPRQHTR